MARDGEEAQARRHGEYIVVGTIVVYGGTHDHFNTFQEGQSVFGGRDWLPARVPSELKPRVACMCSFGLVLGDPAIAASYKSVGDPGMEL